MSGSIARRIKALVKIFLCLFIAVYIIESLYLSFILNSVVNRSYANYGINNPYGNIIDDKFFYYCCGRRNSDLLIELPDYAFNGRLADFFERNSQALPERKGQYLCWPGTDQLVARPGFTENYTKTFPLVIHWFTGGRAVYFYSYEVNKNGRTIHGSWENPVWLKLDFKQKPWVVDVYESMDFNLRYLI